MKEFNHLLCIVLLAACTKVAEQPAGFMIYRGTNLIQPNGEKLYIQGYESGQLAESGRLYVPVPAYELYLDDRLPLQRRLSALTRQPSSGNSLRITISRAKISTLSLSRVQATIRLPFNYKLLPDRRLWDRPVLETAMHALTVSSIGARPTSYASFLICTLPLARRMAMCETAVMAIPGFVKVKLLSSYSPDVAWE